MNKIYKNLISAVSWIKATIQLRLHSDVQYKIVGFSDKTYIVSILCNVTRIVFHQDIVSILFNSDIITQMFPEQACYLGLMAGLALRQGKVYVKEALYGSDQNSSGISKSRESLMFDRHGNVIFVRPKTHEICVMRPERIVSQNELIRLFNSDFACAIEFHLGYRRNASIDSLVKKKHLQLIR